MFSIYVPGRRGEATALLKSVGAGWALDPSVTAMATEVLQDGPDGGGGTLVYFEQRGVGRTRCPSAYNAERQQWEPAAPRGDLAAGRFWVGLWKEYRPTADDLRRERVSDGLLVKLLDGGEWQVPLAQYLPKKFVLDRTTGKEGLAPLPEHRDFVERSESLFQYLIGDDFQNQVETTREASIPGGFTFAAEALSKNYRVELDLIEMLGLIGGLEAVQIAAIVTGLELEPTPGERADAQMAGIT